MAAVQRTAQRAQTAVDQILDQVRASPVVHADETGWRQDGHNGYVWTCSTPTHRYFLRRNRSKAVVDEALGDAASALVYDFYAPTTITTAPYNAAGLTCCGISTTCDPSTPMMHHWPGGLMPSTRFTTGPRPLPIPRPGSSPDQAAAHCPTGFGETPAGHLPAPPRRRLSNPGQAVPTHRAPHPGTLCLRSRTGGATGQQRRRTQPATSGRQSQGQRRHPVGRGQQQQDDPGRFIRHLARPRTQSPRRLPATALFPSTQQLRVFRNCSELMRSSATSRNSLSLAEPGVPPDSNAAERSQSGRQSQGQRRHPVGRGQQQQDDPARHLARPRTQSPRRLPDCSLPLNSEQLRVFRNCC